MLYEAEIPGEDGRPRARSFFMQIGRTVARVRGYPLGLFGRWNWTQCWTLVSLEHGTGACDLALGVSGWWSSIPKTGGLPLASGHWMPCTTHYRQRRWDAKLPERARKPQMTHQLKMHQFVHKVNSWKVITSHAATSSYALIEGSTMRTSHKGPAEAPRDPRCLPLPLSFVPTTQLASYAAPGQPANASPELADSRGCRITSRDSRRSGRSETRKAFLGPSNFCDVPSSILTALTSAVFSIRLLHRLKLYSLNHEHCKSCCFQAHDVSKG